MRVSRQRTSKEILCVAFIPFCAFLFQLHASQSHGQVRSSIKSKKTGETITLSLSGEKIDAIGGTQGRPLLQIWKATKGGYFFLSSSVPTLLPDLPSDSPRWKYVTHCVLQQSEHDDNVFKAYIDPESNKQRIFYAIQLAFDKNGHVHATTYVPIWLNGAIHEIQGRVVFGPKDKHIVLQSAPNHRLVFEVSERKGYVHRGGKGTVTCPNGVVLELNDGTIGKVIGGPRSTTEEGRNDAM